MLLPALCVALLWTGLPATAQDAVPPAGFDALGADPFAAGLFETVAVTPGPPARVLARNVQGSTDAGPFVNVLRWTDARRFRGKLLAVGQRARLEVAAPDTTARLWVRVLRADGSVAFEDDGIDVATSSAEWTALQSIGAVAADATDLWFGLIVEGTTPVHVDEFTLEVRGEVSPADLRLAVPQRWTRDPDVRNARTTDPSRGLDLRVTSFVPPGHPLADLPHLWLLREGDDLRDTYLAGRTLLEGMRLGLEPPAVVSFVQVREGALQAGVTALVAGDTFARLVRPTVDSELGRLAVHSIATPATNGAQVAFHLDAADTPAPSPAFTAAVPPAAPGAHLQAERVHLRWARARHDAAGDADLTGLLFEAALASLEPWDAPPAVRSASHSLAGHDCGHDHSQGSGHTHSHD